MTLLLGVFFSASLVAQTTTNFTGASNNQWHTGANWSNTIGDAATENITTNNNMGASSPVVYSSYNYTIGNLTLGNSTNLTIQSGASLTLGSSALFNTVLSPVTTQISASNTAWPTPVGVRSISTIEAWGGGGAGGGATGNNSTGGGGAGGSYAVRNGPISVIYGNTLDITIGTGGTGGTGTGGNGLASSVSNSTGTTYVSALGGNGGSAGTSNGSNGSNGAALTTGGTGDIIYYGGRGGSSTGTTTGRLSGPGGGAAGSTGNGGNATLSTASGTAGTGLSPGGNGALGVNTGSGVLNGGSGSTYGGGGSGGFKVSGGSNASGGAGASGLVQITYTPVDKRNLTMGNGSVLTIAGGLEIWGDLIIPNGMTLDLTGTMKVHGDVIALNNGTVNIAGTGNLSVDGDFYANNNLTATVDGNVTITGTLSVGNGSTLTGSGSINAGGGCTGPSGFCNQILPVKIGYFHTSVADQTVKLLWATYAEENFEKFIIQRSSDGIAYEDIGQVAGLGFDIFNIETKYSFLDKSPLLGFNYYRLKAVDMDGTFEYHGPRTAKIAGIKHLSISPNPSSGEEIFFRTNFSPSESDLIVVIDQLGTELLRLPVSSLQNKIKLDSRLKAGIYFLRYVSTDYNEVVRVLIRN